MFVVVANLLLVSLIVPETRFNGKDYEIREQVGLIFPGTSQMPHILENIGADAVRFSSDELKQFNTNVAKAESKGERLPKMVLDFSNAEALPKK